MSFNYVASYLITGIIIWIISFIISFLVFYFYIFKKNVNLSLIGAVIFSCVVLIILHALF